MFFYKKSFSFNLLFLLLCLNSPIHAATLHAIIVADTQDIRIGSSIDRDSIQTLVQGIADNTNLELKLQLIDGKSISRKGEGNKKVKETIQSLAVTPDDLVIFYYSGHGTGSASKWPSLAVEGQFTTRAKLIPLDWFKDELLRKKPHLLLVLADACNRALPGMASGRPKAVFGNEETYKKLFLDHTGYILASGSQGASATYPDGEFSYGSTQGGGLFTAAFLERLERELESENPKWKNIAHDLDGKPLKTGAEKQPEQHPQFENGTLEVAISKTMQSCPHPKGTCSDRAYWSDASGGCYCCSKDGQKMSFEKALCSTNK